MKNFCSVAARFWRIRSKRYFHYFLYSFFQSLSCRTHQREAWR